MLHTLRASQFIRADIDTVWSFMSSPTNLAKITPDYMGFEIVGNLTNEKMYAGQIIEYNVKPLLGINLHWVTEITHVKENEFFVDEQRLGPYSFWHHKHFLKETATGVEMNDLVHYKLPFGVAGKLVNTLFVKKQLTQIFEYRYKKVEELFNSKT